MILKIFQEFWEIFNIFEFLKIPPKFRDCSGKFQADGHPKKKLRHTTGDFEVKLEREEKTH